MKKTAQAGIPALIVLTFLLALCSPVARAESSADELGFLDGLGLVVLDTDDIFSLHEARNLIHAYGGHIAIMSPPSHLIGWIPEETRTALIGQSGIRNIYVTEVPPGEMPAGGNPSRAMVRFFNAAVRGDLRAEREPMSKSPSDTGNRPWEKDLFEPPPIDREAYLENLRAVGIDPAGIGDGPDLAPSEIQGNSDFMTGTVALTVFFVESDGSSTDPDLYTWIPEHMQSYLNGVATGLAFWASRAATFSDCWVSFLINYHSGADPRCQQWVEPILHSSDWETTWVNAIMANFGYSSGGMFTRVTAFNTWQRSYYQTDRSYSAFVPYNPPPAPASFPNGSTAYAWYGGPHTVLLFNITGSSTAEVFAHESGHIFYACDEYAGGCGSSSCTNNCHNGATNGNCEACNPQSRDCVMKANTFSLCQYTPTHVGWAQGPPCAPAPPPPLPAPTATVSYPASGLLGTQLTVTVGGTNFVPGAKVEFEGDVFVDITTLVGAESLVLDVTILNDVAPGPRDVKVVNPDGQSATLVDAFEILPTYRHYFSPSGGNVFPYISPANAAIAFEDAVGAAGTGDTLFVPTMTFNNFSLALTKGVLLHGAWDSGFTSRDLVSGKTVLDLQGNVSVNPGAVGGGLDGFILENGTGSFSTTPTNGYYGGAIRLLSSAARVANCEIRMSAASTGGNLGLGGGIYAENCQVEIHDNYIHQNDATRGGGIYLHKCSGSLTGNTVSNNSLSLGPLSAMGAGVMVDSSSSVTLADNDITSNTGASEGGGLLLRDTDNVTIDGGVIGYHSTGSQGGGAYIIRSAVSIQSLDVEHNSAGTIGGGVSTSGQTALTVEDSRLLWNTSLIGGGLYMASGTAEIHHNLFVGNSGNVSGGAILVGAITGGALTGNTLDRNASSGPGGMSLPNAAIEVFNNIVVNSTGSGVSCPSGSPVALSYNLVWNNSGGDYVDCSPGIGAVSGDPVFADTSANDYHLGPHSPAIDAGKPGLDDPDGSPGDLGWYGSHAIAMAQPSYPKNLTAQIQGADLILEWSQNPEDDIDSYAVYCDTLSGFVPSVDNFITFVPGTDSTTTLAAPDDSTFYRIAAIDTSGYSSGYSNEAVAVTPTGIGDRIVSYSFRLDQNVPNPFNPTTRISYEIPAPGPVSLRVYRVDGTLVRELVSVTQYPGRYTIDWDGRNTLGAAVSSGIYFYRLEAGALVETRKMILLK